ncbi:DNA-invertase hin [Symmachiella dynata]|uniref:DNA-invertase hin n=1 Tax=Symmachiella dynata TaxID=2527995 RepID=A0A517ZPX0_9PLAN|nr:recombinase family protein [Symmachiella dynata]QDU44539.1 DNA-invertase hin [Symmachiella dynata]
MNSNCKTSTIRCAIYTRKSTSEGLDQDFNSLDAQRESAEAFIASHRHEGWQVLADDYSDGGFSGGDMQRPGVKRLLQDIEAGQIDCVVVYKVDRLSRSLLDFARMMQSFETHGVSFVSVTQQFNTTHSMGRLTLNILLSFAQFEREMISERTRDKMAAARRKGKYVGGPPILGYDIIDTKLVVNDAEAEQVRTIFAFYLEHQSLLSAVAEVNRQGWTTKRWVTKKETTRGGRAFDKTSLHKLLTNVAYSGKVRYQQTIYDGQHAGIVDPATFQRVQHLLRLNRTNKTAAAQNGYAAPLKGLLRCAPCGCHMSHAHTVRKKTRCYRYYVCNKSQKLGRAACPSQPVPAAEIERFVVDQIREIGRDPRLVADTLAALSAEWETDQQSLDDEARELSRELGRLAGEMERWAAVDDQRRLANAQQQVAAAERRLAEIRNELTELQREHLTEADVRAALAGFDPLWDGLSMGEQALLLQDLLKRVDYDGQEGTIGVTPPRAKPSS